MSDKSKPSPRINITKDAAGDRWHCVIDLQRSIRWPLPVMGQLTEDGPWIDGYGTDPESALRAAYENLGRAAAKLLEP